MRSQDETRQSCNTLADADPAPQKTAQCAASPAFFNDLLRDCLAGLLIS
jgi:hypothetical protein